MRKLAFSWLLVGLFVLQAVAPAQAAPAWQAGCLFFTETGGGQGGFSVCDDGSARFRSAFERWGLQRIGYPISHRYMQDGFITQAYQKAIMQWRADTGSVALVNIFDDLHRFGYDQVLLDARQTPLQLPEGWDGPGLSFEQVVQKRQALLGARPALRQAYFSVGDPLTFFGLPTSEIQDMGNHYAIRLQRAVLQEWKQDVPWARAGQVTVANGGDIAKELGALPASALVPQPGGSPPPAPPTQPPPDRPGDLAGLVPFAAADVEAFWQRVFNNQGVPYSPVAGVQAYGETLMTPCGPIETGNAGYCPRNNTIYYDANFLGVLLASYGDYAVIVVLAHEWGHHVATELRLRTNYTIEDELLADCLAGVYSWDADSRGLLRQGDVDEAVALFYDFGDDASVPWFDPFAHGTPDQRREAFERGFFQGSNACFGLD